MIKKYRKIAATAEQGDPLRGQAGFLSHHFHVKNRSNVIKVYTIDRLSYRKKG
jgi:hypothetical protein